MSIHHRSSSRIPLALTVNIKHKGKYIGSTSTRNINPFGAFIELSATELGANDFVELHFLDKQQKRTYLKQKGLIMHRNKEGVGVMFAHDLDEFRTLLAREAGTVNANSEQSG